MYFRYFIIIFPWKRTESQSLKDALCQVWFKLAHWFWRSRSKISSMYFCYFVINSPWKRAWPLIWKNLNPLNPRMLCAKYGWIWLSGSGREDFLNFVNWKYFHYFVIISPWKRAGPSFKQTWIPFTQGFLCQVWLYIAMTLKQK